MSESNKKAGGNNTVWIAVTIVVAFIVFAGLFGATSAQKKQHEAQELAATLHDDAEAQDEADDVEVEIQIVEGEPEDVIENSSEQSQAFVEDSANEKVVMSEDEADEFKRLTTPRILGNPDAPIKIKEFSSLTCGHCGTFHLGTFKKIKEELIDTGKAYIELNDFPLNAPALHGSMVARCLPNDKYFDFVQLLFETQKDWAYKADYVSVLKQNAMLAGLSSEAFTACLQNHELQEALTKGIQDAQTKYDVNSTPTFVINDTVTVVGSAPYDLFLQKIEEAEAKKAE